MAGWRWDLVAVKSFPENHYIWEE
ncbi:hypothetical protein PIIN_11805 [Serendipita indica DSM 11827]|uniref:Uncharacterized protein n=1 Tax=Serendipita indica (strain DSM 11827) TaxID=1109443 RepID=G4TZ23_SERID|nr:hypothetical protein PIIN_11805 [Serendipita indica DSM 11827]